MDIQQRLEKDFRTIFMDGDLVETIDTVKMSKEAISHAYKFWAQTAKELGWKMTVKVGIYNSLLLYLINKEEVCQD